MKWCDGETLLQVSGLLRGLAAGRGSLAASLALVLDELEEGPMRKILTPVQADLERGRSLAEALASQRCFPEDFIAVVRMGEASGRLAETLGLLTAYRSASLRLQRMVGRAMAYPLAIITLLLVVLPLYATHFTAGMAGANPHAQLPGSARAVIVFWHGAAVAAPFLYGAATLSAAYLILYGLGWNAALARWFEPVTFHLPLYGKIVRYHSAAKLAWLMRVPLEAGMTLPEALEMAEKAQLPWSLRRTVGRLADRARKGQALGPVIEKARHLPLTCRCLMALAEETNNLVPTLHLIAEQFQRETQSLAERFPRTVGALLLVVTATLVGLSAWAMYSPLGFIAFM